MPTPTKAGTYDAYMNLGMYSYLCSLILDNDNDLDTPESYLDELEDSWEEPEETSLSELLQLAGVDWEAIAMSFYQSGPGSRGPYNGIPKSVNFFSCCLSAPPRTFRHMFRLVLCMCLAMLRCDLALCIV